MLADARASSGHLGLRIRHPSSRRLQEASFPLLPQPIALAFNIDGHGMVEQSIENRRGDDGISEDLAPGPEALVAGEQNRPLLVAP